MPGKRLTPKHWEAIEHLSKSTSDDAGMFIYGRELANTLREVALIRPKYVALRRAMTHLAGGTNPYFRAVLLEGGRTAVAKRQERRRR